jgi:hypothetical protein
MRERNLFEEAGIKGKLLKNCEATFVSGRVPGDPSQRRATRPDPVLDTDLVR